MKRIIGILIILVLSALVFVLFVSCKNSSDNDGADPASPDQSGIDRAENGDTAEEAETEPVNKPRPYLQIDGDELQILLNGKTETVGKFEIFVPGNSALEPGDGGGSFSLIRSDGGYISFTEETSEAAMTSSYEKSSDPGLKGRAEVSMTMGGADWTGIEYDVDGSAALELYAEDNGSFIRVSAVGYQIYSTETWLILSSLRVNK